MSEISKIDQQILYLIKLFENKNFDEVISQSSNLFKENKKLSILPNLIGASYSKKNQNKEAIKFYKIAINLDNKNYEYFNNLGKSQLLLNKYDEAKESFLESIKLNSKNYDGYFNLGIIYQEKNLYSLSIQNYKIAIKINNNFPIAHYNLAIVYSIIGENDSSINHYKKSIDLNKFYLKAYNNLGALYIKLKEKEFAKKYLSNAITLDPEYYEANHNLGVLELEDKNYSKSLSYFKKIIKKNPKFLKSYVQMMYIERKICDWTNFDKSKKNIKEITESCIEATPWQLLSIDDDPFLELKRAYNYSSKFKTSDENIKIKKKNKIRIGYFTPDFFEHAGMINMEGIFKYHNKDKYEVYGFDYGYQKKDKTHFRIKEYFDNFFYVADMNDNQIADLSRRHDIDIAIHRNGHSQNSRSNIFSYRAAPLQLSFLGYPGTTGLDFIDYILADKIVIPNENIKCFSEKIIFMPDTYYPTFNERKISTSIVTRNTLGISKDSLVLCCFNNSYKISPVEFDIWARIINKLNNCYLILLVENDEIKKNLQHEANKRNVDIKKIKFLNYINNQEHLGRHSIGDIYLDTFNYNGHTSIVDSLYSGLPVITKIGKSFSSRVGASLLNSFNMKNLITTDAKQYEDLIFELLKDRTKLSKIKEQVKINISNSNLFNTKKYVSNLEKAFEIIVHNKLNDKKLENIEV